MARNETAAARLARTAGVLLQRGEDLHATGAETAAWVGQTDIRLYRPIIIPHEITPRLGGRHVEEYNCLL
jgi:hypothetical protein